MDILVKLSVVLPCYNESENLPYIFSRFSELFRKDMPIEVIIVNNGSTDNSIQVFEQQALIYNDERFKIINVTINKGYGFGILAGLEIANGHILAWTHADMQTDFFDIFTAFDIYLKYNDAKIFVKGNRKNRAIIPSFFTWGMGAIASMVLGKKLTDIGAQPKLFSKHFYESSIKDQAPYDFSLDLFAQYQAKKYGIIIQFPVYFAKRIYGKAKGGGSLKTRIKVTQRVLKFIFDLRISIKNKITN